MCRNIRTLFNFEPPATEDEIHASALQFVRKLSGFNKPSQANAEASRGVERTVFWPQPRRATTPGTGPCKRLKAYSRIKILGDAG